MATTTNDALKFTAIEAISMSKQALYEKENFDINVYTQIIERIKNAASNGRTMIRLPKGDYLERLCTRNIISHLEESGFKVKEARLSMSLYDSDYLGIDISWE